MVLVEVEYGPGSFLTVTVLILAVQVVVEHFVEIVVRIVDAFGQVVRGHLLEIVDVMVVGLEHLEVTV
jgi:hypothetical protein